MLAVRLLPLRILLLLQLPLLEPVLVSQGFIGRGKEQGRAGCPSSSMTSRPGGQPAMACVVYLSANPCAVMALADDDDDDDNDGQAKINDSGNRAVPALALTDGAIERIANRWPRLISTQAETSGHMDRQVIGRTITEANRVL